MEAPYYDCIAHNAMRQPASLATVDLTTGRRHTYAAFDRRIARVAEAMRTRFAIKAGDRVALLAMNTTDTFDVQFACWRLGAIFVPLNWRLANPELRAILADCTPALFIHGSEFAERAEQLAGPWQMFGFGPAFEAVANDGPGLRHSAPVTQDDLSTILYTSGTTGLPKGVMITHGMNTWNSIHCIGAADLNRATVFLTVLPLFHAGGLNVFANPLFFCGGTVLVMQTFDAGDALRLLGDPAERIDCFFGVPANYQFMCQHPDFPATDLTRIRYASVGAAPTPDAIFRAWAERGVVLQQLYGMTETSPLVLSLDREDALRKMGSAGKPIMHMQARVVDADGKDAPRNAVGELWLKGPIVTQGYWKKPDVTASAITGGWLHTGDAAVVDDEGFYYIVDRWKDMYISGGENVYPAEIENVLYQLDAIAEAAVIGINDTRWGQVGRAVVVLKPGRDLTEDEIIAHCAPNLARYKLPHSVVFTEALPRNATGKVHKPTLRQTFGDR